MKQGIFPRPPPPPPAPCMAMSPGQCPNRMDSVGSAPSSARPGGKDTNSAHSHFVPTLSSAPCCEVPHSGMCGIPQPSSLFLAKPTSLLSCKQPLLSHLTSLRICSLQAGQGWSPWVGNAMILGTWSAMEERKVAWAWCLELSSIGWLEDAWSRAFQLEGLRVGPWLSGRKQVLVKKQTNKLFIPFYFYL